MHGARVATHGTGLVALQLPHEMPGEVEIGELGRLRGGLLVPVLPDVSHPEFEELPHERRRMELGHDDAGQLCRVAPGRTSRVCDPAVDVGEAIGEAAVGHYFKKSGTSRSSSSSKSRSSGATGCVIGRSGSADQPPSLSAPALWAPTATGTCASTKLVRC